jgi:hypothetical protein
MIIDFDKEWFKHYYTSSKSFDTGSICVGGRQFDIISGVYHIASFNSDPISITKSGELVIKINLLKHFKYGVVI